MTGAAEAAAGWRRRSAAALDLIEALEGAAIARTAHLGPAEAAVVCRAASLAVAVRMLARLDPAVAPTVMQALAEVVLTEQAGSHDGPVAEEAPLRRPPQPARGRRREAVERRCLRCSRAFIAGTRFIRLCPTCRREG